MAEEIDEDGSGAIEFPEFLKLMAKKMKDTDAEEELVEAFKVFDKEGRGEVSIEELKQAMINIGEKTPLEEIEDMVEELREGCVDGSGMVKYELFVKMMMGK
mmetsp:Transcript_26966/g.20175  ORF Transcript_26966/g.20175 Transcript_26966/m.20175 type:complete len:102 (-) Transcript_26966:20-325(-)